MLNWPLMEPPAPLPRRRVDPAWWLFYLVLFSLAVAVLGPLLWKPALEKRAIEQLAADDRATAYQLALTTVRDVCMHDSNDALRTHCRHEAEFLSYCPECDAGCRQLVHAILRDAPTR